MLQHVNVPGGLKASISEIGRKEGAAGSDTAMFPDPSRPSPDRDMPGSPWYPYVQTMISDHALVIAESPQAEHCIDLSGFMTR